MNDARHKKLLADLKKAKRKPRVVVQEPDGGAWSGIESCVICGTPTRHWLQPENAPLCKNDGPKSCLRVYLSDPTVYDPCELYEKSTRTPKPPANVLSPLEAGIEVIRRLLKTMRWDEQGGYVMYKGGGKWSGVGMGLGTVTPDELNALFAMAGMEPDVIEAKGSCSTCAFAQRGQERGWSTPCAGEPAVSWKSSRRTRACTSWPTCEPGCPTKQPPRQHWRPTSLCVRSPTSTSGQHRDRVYCLVSAVILLP